MYETIIIEMNMVTLSKEGHGQHSIAHRCHMTTKTHVIFSEANRLSQMIRKISITLQEGLNLRQYDQRRE